MALYFKSKQEAFRELRVGDLATELYGVQTRKNLLDKFSDASRVFGNVTPAAPLASKAGE